MGCSKVFKAITVYRAEWTIQQKRKRIIDFSGRKGLQDKKKPALKAAPAFLSCRV